MYFTLSARKSQLPLLFSITLIAVVNSECGDCSWKHNCTCEFRYSTKFFTSTYKNLTDPALHFPNDTQGADLSSNLFHYLNRSSFYHVGEKNLLNFLPLNVYNLYKTWLTPTATKENTSRCIDNQTRIWSNLTIINTSISDAGLYSLVVLESNSTTKGGHQQLRTNQLQIFTMIVTELPGSGTKNLDLNIVFLSIIAVTSQLTIAMIVTVILLRKRRKNNHKNYFYDQGSGGCAHVYEDIDAAPLHVAQRRLPQVPVEEHASVVTEYASIQPFHEYASIGSLQQKECSYIPHKMAVKSPFWSSKSSKNSQPTNLTHEYAPTESSKNLTQRRLPQVPLEEHAFVVSESASEQPSHEYALIGSSQQKECSYIPHKMTAQSPCWASSSLRDFRSTALNNEYMHAKAPPNTNRLNKPHKITVEPPFWSSKSSKNSQSTNLTHEYAPTESSKNKYDFYIPHKMTVMPPFSPRIPLSNTNAVEPTQDGRPSAETSSPKQSEAYVSHKMTKEPPLLLPLSSRSSSLTLAAQEQSTVHSQPWEDVSNTPHQVVINPPFWTPTLSRSGSGSTSGAMNYDSKLYLQRSLSANSLIAISIE